MNISQLYQMMNLYNSIQQSGMYGSRTVGGQNAFLNVLHSTAAAQGGVQTSGGMATPMDAIFEEASRATGVDVRLLKAVGKAESGFNASATSHCGAMGVMQLMPGTAAGLGVSNAYDARENIMGGARYLAQLLKQYDGNTELALAAYSAGSGNVKKYGGIPPFTETQNYVRRVMEYAGTDFSSGKTVTEADGGAIQSYTAGSSSVTGTLEYGEFFKLMAQMMQIEMEQKLQSILDFNTEDTGW